MQNLILKIFIFYIFTVNSYATTININENTYSKYILDKSYIYLSNNLSSTLNDIKNKDIKLIKNSKKIMMYKNNSNLKIWIKFTIKNNSNQTVEKVLRYKSTYTIKIYFYKEDKERKLECLLHTNKNRKSVTPYFNIKLAKNDIKTYYYISLCKYVSYESTCISTK